MKWSKKTTCNYCGKSVDFINATDWDFRVFNKKPFWFCSTLCVRKFSLLPTRAVDEQTRKTQPIQKKTS